MSQFFIRLASGPSLLPHVFFAERVLLLSSHQGQETPYSHTGGGKRLAVSVNQEHPRPQHPTSVALLFTHDAHELQAWLYERWSIDALQHTHSRVHEKQANVQESSLIPSERPAILIAVTSLDHRPASAALEEPCFSGS